MSKIDIGSLIKDMVTAAKGVIKKEWPDLKAYAECEFKKIGESILFIESQHALGKMTEEQAKLQMDIQKNASRTVLLAIEGVGLLRAEAIINAALKKIKDAVNNAVGFVLIV